MKESKAASMLCEGLLQSGLAWTTHLLGKWWWGSRPGQPTCVLLLPATHCRKTWHHTRPKMHVPCSPPNPPVLP